MLLAGGKNIICVEVTVAFGNQRITEIGTHNKEKSDVKTGRLGGRPRNQDLLATCLKSVLVSKDV